MGKKQGGHNCADKRQLKQRHAKKTRRLQKNGGALAGAQKGGGAFCYFSELPYSSNSNPAMLDCRCVVPFVLYRLFCTLPQFYRMKQRERNLYTLVLNSTMTNYVLVIIDILFYPIVSPSSRNILLEIRMTACNRLLNF